MANKFEVKGFVDTWSTGDLIRALNSPTTLGDVDIFVDSPGGYVTAGVRAYNAMRDYTNGKINVRVGAMAASAAAFFPMAADTIEVRDNTMFMIHNAWVWLSGEAKDLEREASLLRSMDKIIAGALSKKSGLEVKDVALLMDAETYLFGSEIVEKGFADVMLDTEDAKDKETALNLTRLEVQEAKNHAKKEPDSVKDLKACLNAMQGDAPAVTPGTNVNDETNNQERQPPSGAVDNQGDTVSFTQADLDKARNEGREAGIKELQESVNCHLANLDRDKENVLANIKGGVIFNMEHMSNYLNAKPMKDELNSRETENADDVTPPGGDDEDSELKNSAAALAQLTEDRGVK